MKCCCYCVYINKRWPGCSFVPDSLEKSKTSTGPAGLSHRSAGKAWQMSNLQILESLASLKGQTKIHEFRCIQLSCCCVPRQANSETWKWLVKEKKANPPGHTWVCRRQRTGFITSSLQCIDDASTQQLPQKFQLNAIICKPVVFSETTEHSKEFSFKLPALIRTLKSLQ